jgi:protein-L-isoaspartate(D-aspartate) O-methyltransferase
LLLVEDRARYICGMRAAEDTYRHKGLRKKLMELVRSKGITDEKVLEAIGKVPRHYFPGFCL